MKKPIKEFLEYAACFILTVTPILILALLLISVYGTRDSAKAGTIRYQTINHYDSADELYTELLVKQHMVKHTHVDAIDQAEPCIDISAIEQAKIIIVMQQGL